MFAANRISKTLFLISLVPSIPVLLVIVANLLIRTAARGKLHSGKYVID